MKRPFFFLLNFILFSMAFLVSAYSFAPWREIGRFTVSSAHSLMQKRGIRLNFSHVSDTEHSFVIHNISLQGAVNISASSVSVKPEILSSLLSLAPVFRIEFAGASVRLGQTMRFGDGSFLVTAGREIILDGIHSDGDFSIDGYMTVDTSSMRIGRAEARLKIPDTFSQNMNMLKNFLPLTEQGGNWYLRRK